MTRLFSALIALSLFLLGASSAQAATVGLLDWQPYGEAAFEKARKEKRLVLLELEAVWCHWCHVMDVETWSRPEVAAAIRKGFVPVRVDHDARPDLAERYRDYGWPAIIILDANGRDLAKRAGYVPPQKLLKLLAQVRANPVPQDDEREPSQYALSPLLAEDVADKLKYRFFESHDFKIGGLKGGQKFVDRDAVEYALLLAQRGDARALQMVKDDMAATRRLSDPVWGGVYQYSTDGDFDHLHFEKLGFIQADYLRVVALSYGSLRDPRDLRTLHEIHAYLHNFLRAPDGAFYVSQDADLRPGEHAEAYFDLDDRGRRAQGMPRIDTHIYAKENGLIAAALVAAYQASGEAIFLEDARLALQHILRNHRLGGGGFRHGAEAQSGVYLADNLAMLRGLLAMYGASGERHWLKEAQGAADLIAQRFTQGDEAGYFSAARSGPLAPVRSLEDNLALARAANLLHHYSGAAPYRAMAERAMRYLVTPAVALSRSTDPGILLAAEELAREPAHLCIVGAKDDPQAASLFRAAVAWPSAYKRVEWWDRREGDLPNPDVAYPALARSAAYVCSEGRCSRPLFNEADFLALARELAKRNAPL